MRPLGVLGSRRPRVRRVDDAHGRRRIENVLFGPGGSDCDLAQRGHPLSRRVRAGRIADAMAIARRPRSRQQPRPMRPNTNNPAFMVLAPCFNTKRRSAHLPGSVTGECAPVAPTIMDAGIDANIRQPTERPFRTNTDGQLTRRPESCSHATARGSQARSPLTRARGCRSAPRSDASLECHRRDGPIR